MKKIKVLAYCPLAYGKDYLYWAIKAVYPVVDEILLLYSDMSQQRTKLICPDTEEEIKEQAYQYDPENKIKWTSKDWHVETQQWEEAKIYAIKNGFDVAVWFDFDEIWETEKLAELIKYVYDNPTEQLLCWMRHLWRSFDWICDDAMRQNRMYTLKNKKGSLLYAPLKTNCIWHFGYARKLVDIEYKESIHLHKDEWRDNWYEEKFKGWKPGIIDTHPTCVGHWNPESVKKGLLPNIMKDHPYYNSKLIC